MTVTRSTYEQRQQKRGANRAPSPRARMRPLELVLLSVVTLVLILGAFMTQRRSLEPYGNQTGLVHINEADSVSQWLPLFASLPTPEDRNYAARQARQHRMEHGAYENLNALGRLQVSVLEIDQNSGLAGYQNRLRVARQAKAKDAKAIESLALLSASELRDVSRRGMVRSVGEFRSMFWLSFLGLVGAFLLVHLLWVVRGFEGDSWILPLLLFLCGIGFLVTTGLQDPLQDQLRLTRFAWGVMAGLGLLAVGSQLNLEMRTVRKSGGVAFAAAIGLALLLVTLGSGPGQSDAKVNLFGFQPIELIKVLATLFFAAYFADRWEFLREIREQRVSALNRFHWLSLPRLEYFLPPVLAVLVILTFFFMQRDLGPALTLSLVFFLLYGVARGRFTMLVLGLGAIVAAFGLGYALRFPATVSSRVGMWFSPWESSSSLGDHLAKAWWSLSSGGFTGVGIGRGSPEIVPAAHTDMVLVAIGEELGWFGFLVVTLLFSALLYRLFKACRTAKGPFSFFLATGLTLLLAIQFCIIAGGVLGLMPLSGVVTPFLSYGRTSMLINLATVGLLLSVSASPGLVRSVQIFRPALNRIGAVLGIAMIVIVGRAGAIQVVQQSKYMGEPCLVEQADDVRRFTYNPRLRSLARLIPRGDVLDRNGIPLASSNPALLSEHRTFYHSMDLALADLDSTRTNKRYYPLGGRTYHFLGDHRTQRNWGASNTSFVERDESLKLQGFDDYASVVNVEQPDGATRQMAKRDYRELMPLVKYAKNPKHKKIQELLAKDRTVRTTLDARLQVLVGNAVRDTLLRRGVESASVVVLDAQSGELRAMVNFPWPDETVPGQMSGEILLDRARYGTYPPGSTFKIVTAMAALDKNPALIEKTYLCRRLESGRVGNQIEGWGRPVRCYATTPHGDVGLSEALVYSCNAYFAQLAVDGLGGNALLSMASRFGIDVASPNTPETLRDALHQASFGQGQVLATPLEMARVAATVSNGGVVPPTTWIADSGTGERRGTRVLEESQNDVIARAMRNVVIRGTARSGGFGMTVSGKTGTAEVANGASHSWFIGFGAPASGVGDVAVSVIVEHGGAGSGAATRVGHAVFEACQKVLGQPVVADTQDD